MNEITITSATLKGSYGLKYSYVKKSDEESNNINIASNGAVHPELKKSLQNLIPHFALICEQEREKDVKKLIIDGFPDQGDEPHPMIQKYTVNSFKITGNDESEGVEISGTKLLSIGKSIKITSPKIKWDDKDYKFVSALAEAVETCKVEVNEYLNGKRAPDNQLKMFEEFTNDLDAEVQIVKSAS